MSDLRRFAGQWFVVKIGGELAQEPARLASSVGASVRAFLEAGVRVAVVHGGGPQATLLSARLGIETQQVSGRRITDAATLEVMKMALAGQAATDVARAFRMAGVNALCTTGVSASLVDAAKRPPHPVDMGWVGDVTQVNQALLEALAGVGVVPVLASLCGDAAGNVFNVNADTVATRLASALRAARLFLVSNVPGVLRDRSDPATRIPTLTPEEAREQMNRGTISGGMIPKVEESLAMLDQGIGAIHILGTDPPDALLCEAKAPGSRGTAFLRERLPGRP